MLNDQYFIDDLKDRADLVRLVEQDASSDGKHGLTAVNIRRKI